MSTTNHESAFLNRFRTVWVRKRRVALGQVGITMLLAGLVGIGLLALADHRLELAHSARLAAVVALAGAVVLFAAGLLWRSVQHWGQPTTAAQIEAAFPELGQSVRTTVQFGTMKAEQVQSEGVATTLVTALAEQTRQHALPLPIEDVVPIQRLAWIAAAFVAVAVTIAGASTVDWEWRNATSRAFLGDSPYRHLMVLPGDQTVAEGDEASIQIALIGRTNRELILVTRPVDEPDASWTERTLVLEEPAENRLEPAAQSSSTTRATPISDDPDLAVRPRVNYSATLDHLMKPLEYRVTVGPLSSAIYRIDIRRPLRIEEVKVELTPPTYTAQPSLTTVDPNLSALEGTQAKFEIQFDKAVKSASLVFAPRRQPRDEEDKNEPIVMPLTLLASQRSSQRANPKQSAADASTVGTITIAVTEDCNYSIVAEADDGTVLAENKYRIRVRQDQPPQVSFESPDETTEVHTLAELPMRIRVRDDYGLAKAGVIFQINNEQEVPLIAQDFATVAAAASELASTGTISLTTQTALEKILPLEYFELTQKDSVMYFAFAEDNRPEKPQRAETEMRFIDIRPFKRTYTVTDPDPPNGMMGGSGFKSLEELIKRQRYSLNRTMQIEKQAAMGRAPEAMALEGLMTFEKELAASTRETAEVLQSRGLDDIELFIQSEAAMLAAVDSLSVGKWENATLQMRDALKLLIEARNLISLFIFKNPTLAQMEQMRWADRLMAQKIRRPKTDKEEARELIRRLEALISEESAVVSELASDDEQTPDRKPAESEATSSESEKSKAPNAEAETNGPASQETKEK